MVAIDGLWGVAPEASLAGGALCPGCCLLVQVVGVLRQSLTCIPLVAL